MTRTAHCKPSWPVDIFEQNLAVTTCRSLLFTHIVVKLCTTDCFHKPSSLNSFSLNWFVLVNTLESFHFWISLSKFCQLLFFLFLRKLRIDPIRWSSQLNYIKILPQEYKDWHGPNFQDSTILQTQESWNLQQIKSNPDSPLSGHKAPSVLSHSYA